MTDERLKEIMDTARMLAESRRRSMDVAADETERETALMQWPDIWQTLKGAADLSAYVPNAMRWDRMAEELREWAMVEDAKFMAEPSDPEGGAR